MRRPAMLLFWALVVCTAGLLVSLGGCGGGASTNLPSQKIQHVVVIFQENRTPDNLFHGLPNADIANSGMNSLGQTWVLKKSRWERSPRGSRYLRCASSFRRAVKTKWSPPAVLSVG